MSDKLNVTFSCKACGANPTILELPDDYTYDSVAKCKSCGHEFGRYRDIKAKAMNAAKAKVVGIIKTSLKGVKGLKIK